VIRFLNAYFPARTLFLGISEAFLVAFAFLAATVARLGTDDATVMLNYEQGFLKIFIVAIVFILCMYYFDLYDSMVLSNRREVLTRLVQVLGTVCILLALLYYVFPPLQLGRGIFLIGFLLVALLLFVWRRLFLLVNTMPRFAERALIFGDGPLAQPLMEEIESRSELGVRVVGQLRHLENGDGGGPPLSEAEQFDQLSRQIQSYRASRVIIAMGERRGRLPVEALLRLKSQGITVQDGAEVFEAITGKVPIESLRLSWLLFSPGFHVPKPLLIYKRLFFISDFVFLPGDHRADHGRGGDCHSPGFTRAGDLQAAAHRPRRKGIHSFQVSHHGGWSGSRRQPQASGRGR